MSVPNAASVLLSIREGKATDLASLCRLFGFDPGWGKHYITPILDDLKRADLISTEPESLSDWSQVNIRITSQLGHLQHTFGVSLRQMAEASPDSITVVPYFGHPGHFARKVDAFVVMPFHEGLLPIYQDHITKVASELSITVARGDDFFTNAHIMDDVWKAIWGARVIIADCTGRNPNVFYEIGIAHTIGRPVILITQKREDVPFDLQHIRYLQYDYTPRGMQDFELRLREAIKTVIVEDLTQTPYSGLASS
jgi:hypothetical protein